MLSLALQSFVFLSGFFVALFTFQSLSNGHTVNIITFYLSRVWRQMPVIAIAIGFAIISPLMGSGPVWTETMSHFESKCRTNYWPTLLFFSNYQNIRDMVITIVLT